MKSSNFERSRDPGLNREQEREYALPIGFTLAEEFGGPGTVEAYKDQGLAVPEIGTYSQNNGTIAAVDSEGKIGLWIPKSDPKAPRTVSYEQAIKSLEEAGYKEAGSSFYVPQS